MQIFLQINAKNSIFFYIYILIVDLILKNFYLSFKKLIFLKNSINARFILNSIFTRKFLDYILFIILKFYFVENLLSILCLNAFQSYNYFTTKRW